MYEHTCKKDNKYIISTNSDCVVTDVETGIVLAVVLAKTQKVIQAISDSFTTSVECNIRPFVEATVDIDIIGGGEYDLPAGYKKLEYLESNGTQYIDTLIVPQTDTRLFIDVERVNVRSGTNTLFGVRNEVGSAQRFYDAYFNSATPDDLSLRPCVSTKINFPDGRFTVEFTGSEIKVNGEVVYSYTPEVLTFDSAKTLLLYAMKYTNTSINQWSAIKVYRFRLTSPTETLIDFVPVLNETGTPCMYDTVSHECFSSPTSSDFIIPPDEYAIQTLNLDDVVYGKMTEYGIRRLYKVPAGETMSKTDYAIANGYKEIVEPPMPTDGYWTPHWRETDTQLILEWVETEPPAEEV